MILKWETISAKGMHIAKYNNYALYVEPSIDNLLMFSIYDFKKSKAIAVGECPSVEEGKSMALDSLILALKEELKH